MNGCSDSAEPSASTAIRHRPIPFGSRTSTAMPVSTFFPRCPPTAQPGLLPADERLVHLDAAGQPAPPRPDQHRPQPVQHRPRRRVRADLQRPLKVLGGDPVLGRGKQPARVNHTVSGVCVRSKTVPAVTEVRRPQPPHSCRPSPSRQPPRDRTTGRRNRQASAATPGSPGSPHRCRTRPGTLPSSAGSAPRRADIPQHEPTPVNCIAQSRLMNSAGLCAALACWPW